MTISKQYSIALDSTLSSTPPPSPPSMYPVKRATRTYGRPRDPQPLDDPDSSLTLSESSSASRQSLYRTAPPDVNEEIPPSSEGQSSDDTDAIGLADVLPAQRYRDWRKELAHIDQCLDDDDNVPNGVVPISVPTVVDTSDSLIHNDSPMSLYRESPRETATRSVASPPDGPLDGGSVSYRTSIPDLSQDSPTIHKRNTRRPIAHDSDSEEKDDPSSPTSPVCPNPITTPEFHPASTPPTSVEISKGKGKARDVPPLRFEVAQGMLAPVNFKKKSTKDKRKSSDQQKKTKIKAPTKKELLETKRERLRIAAGQEIFIPHSEDQKYTMEKLFKSIADLIPGEPSDPIQQFSSSPAIRASSHLDVPLIHATSQVPVQHVLSPPKPRGSSHTLRVLDSSSDGDLPDMGDVLHEQKKRDEAERAQSLAEIKRRAVVEAATRRERLVEMGASRSDDDEDDGLEVIGGDKDMHVVAEEEAGERRAMKAKHLKPSEGRKRQLLLAKVSATGDVGGNKGKGTTQKESVGRFKAAGSQNELNRMMAIRVQQTNREMTKRKEEEWIKKGGKVSAMQETSVPTKSVREAAKIYAEKVLKAKEEMARMDIDNSEADQSDEEWTPDTRGSASPDPNYEDHEDAQSEVEVQEASVKEPTPDDGEIVNDDFRPRVPRHATTRRRAVLDSDEENDENKIPTWPGRLYKNILSPNSSEENIVISTPASQMPGMTHRGSLSSFDEPTEDENENDKENNTRLMYDKSEDKENKAVVRHSLGGSARPPLSGVGLLFDGRGRGPSTSPSGPRVSDDEVGSKSRTPFKELLEDDPFASQPTSNFAARLREASPSSPSQPVLAPKPLVFNGGNPQFSQFLDGIEPLTLKPSLKPEFSGNDSNRSISPEPLNALKNGSGAFSQFLSEDPNKSALDRLRNTNNVDGLSLTLDVRLQPALEVSENLMRQADSIFEKEQEYVLEAANRKPTQKVELYVNDHGFLTQTRPDTSSPETYRSASPSQRASTCSSQQLREEMGTAPSTQSILRRPLRTLSLSDELESPGPLRRLRKRSMSPRPPTADEGYRSSISPSPTKRPLNAFEVLAQARDKSLKRLEKSEFVETEAQESDDDEMLGFAGYRKHTAEEEEEGEDLDKTLEGLVDDADMDEKTLGQDLVLEKVKEHQVEDDASLEKRLKAVTEGQLRVKRRNRGLGLDDSDDDDDDDDEEAKRIRRKMFKKRKIENDGLEALGEHEETRPFYNAYHDSDDDNELAHLQTGEDMALVHDEYESDDEPQKVITTTEFRERVREIAQQDDMYESLDPHDVSWLDSEHSQDEDERIRVTEVSLTSKKPYARRRSALDFDGNLEASNRPLENERDRVRMTSWAKSEGRSGFSGTGRSAAVTGHGKPRAKAGGGSLTIARTSSSASTGVDTRKVKASSVLASVADRRSRFDDR